MSLILTFTELDKLYEASSKTVNKYTFVGNAEFYNRKIRSIDRVRILAPIEVTGSSDAEALNHAKFYMRTKFDLPKNTPLKLYNYSLTKISDNDTPKIDELETVNSQEETCEECGALLSDNGTCPVCDDGEEDFTEGLFDNKPNFSNWKAMPNNNAPVATAKTAQSQSVQIATNIVTIVYDNSKHKLMAQADDGVHGKGWVAFPSALRTTDGQQYEVEQLVWNGKNYRVIGNITPVINSVNSVANTQNINENFNKENYEMNFQTILEQLDKLYEEDQEKNLDKKVEVEEKAEAEKVEEKETLTEAAEDEEILVDGEPIEVKEDEAAEEPEETEEVEEVQLVLECENCGALVLKAETAVKVDEETDLANVEEACQYCEEAKGYKIVGTLAPYESAEGEIIEEGIFDKFKKKQNKASSGGNGAAKESKVTIKIYDENGTEQFAHVFTELPGKMSAEEQFNQMIKSNGVLRSYKASSKKSDWSYVRKSNPASPFDTDRYFNAASKLIREAVEADEEFTDDILTEGKLLDTVKKVATRVGADAATIARSFTELGEIIGNNVRNAVKKTDDYNYSKLNDFMEYVENKAVLKALMNGNETVLNTCTKEDIEELAQDIEDYKKAKANENNDKGEEDLEELLDISVPVTATVTANGNNVPFLNGMTN